MDANGHKGGIWGLASIEHALAVAGGRQRRWRTWASTGGPCDRPHIPQTPANAVLCMSDDYVLKTHALSASLLPCCIATSLPPATEQLPYCLCPHPRCSQLCAGHIRVKNSMNILLKNVMDCAFGTLAWFLLGCDMCFGPHRSRVQQVPQ